MWTTLRHSGPYIPPDYTKIPGIDLSYNHPIKGIIVLDTPSDIQQFCIMYNKVSVKDEVFVENFFTDLYKLFPDSWKEYKDFSRFDLSKMIKPEDHITEKVSDEIKDKHTLCYLDGIEQRTSSYTTEVASIFRGLGDNPNRGKIKLAVKAKDVTINTDIPPEEFPAPFGPWKEVICDRSKLYTCSFRSEVTGKVKYIYLNRSSEFKVASEIEKYTKAHELSKIIDDVRDKYMKAIIAENEIGLIVYMMDKFAFRMGNDKPDAVKTAETIGASTLRKENVTLLKDNHVEFNFIAKDSIPYKEIKKLDEEAYKFLEKLMKRGTSESSKTDTSESSDTKNTKNTSKSAPLFSVHSKQVNAWLNDIMDGLTGKVFRTYNSSIMIQERLLDVDMSLLTESKKILDFTDVNADIARLCNHKRNITETEKRRIAEWTDKLNKLDDEIENKKDEKSITRLKAQKEKLADKIIKTKSTMGTALNTSKMNYIDPRLVYRWVKKENIDIKKIYSKSLLDATAWAKQFIEDNPDWDYRS